MKKIILLLALLLTIDNNYPQWVQQKNYLSNWSSGWAIDACDSLNAVLFVPLDNQQGLFITYDGGETWNPRIIPSGSIIDIEMIDKNNIVYGTGYGKIYKTSDSGITWNAVYGDNSVTNFINYVEFFSDHIGIAMGDGISTSTDLVDRPTILYTGTYGISWSHIQTETKTGSYSGDTWRRIDFVNPNVGYFRSSGNIQKFWKTIDMGRTWFEISPTNRIDLLKFYDENIGLIVTYDKPPNPWRIMLTTDGGTTWSLSLNEFNNWPNDLEFIPNDPYKVWFTDSESLYYSSDIGITWAKQILPVENIYGRDIVFVDDKHGWLLCDDGLLFHTNNNGGLISNIESEEILPTDFILEQNYPNPFNPTTTIEYSIHTPTFGVPSREGNQRGVFVTLKVYDILGRELATLVNEYQNPGKYSIIFNVETRRGEFLPCGIYFYTLRVNPSTSSGLVFQETKKMILLK